MNKKIIKTTLLSIIFILLASGCFSYKFSFDHHKDGSGTIKIETILAKEFLDMMDDLGSMTDESEDSSTDVPIFAEEDLKDDPNIKSITQDVFTDPDTGAEHHVLEIEVYDILIPLSFDEDGEAAEGMVYKIEDQDNGNFRFEATVGIPEDFSENDEDGMDPEFMRSFLQDSKFIWELKVDEFVEGDPKASYDSSSHLVTWEIPMTDILFGTAPTEIYAVYKIKSSVFAKPEQKTEPIEDKLDGEATENTSDKKGLFGLPKWVPIVLVSLLCLVLIAAVIVVVIIIAITKKKKNQPQI